MKAMEKAIALLLLVVISSIGRLTLPLALAFSEPRVAAVSSRFRFLPSSELINLKMRVQRTKPSK